MKTMKLNTFLMGLVLLGAASFSNAQQHSTPTPPAPALAGTHARTTSVNGQVAPTPALSGFTYASNDEYFSSTGKKFKEEDLKSKEVSKEVSVPKGGEIYIENSSRGIVVKTWDQPKVKVTTTIYYDGETKLSDDEWLEKVNLSLKTLGTSVKVKSGAVNSSSFYAYNEPINSITINGVRSSTSSGSNVAVFNGLGQNIGTKSNLKRLVTITVPAGSKLDIESKYSDVSIPAGVGDVTVDITNGNLEAENLNKLILRSKYSNINVGDVKTAEVEFNNGRFSAKNIDDLDIESKYSTIEMASAKKIVLRSTNDEYELEEAGEVRARKTYGNLRITKLNTSLEVDGSNADVKVRKIGPALSLIKIDDKYADVRIPLRDQKSYSVDFAGNYSSVYGNFEKVPVASTTAKEGDAGVTERLIRAVPGVRSTGSGLAWDSSNPNKFTASVGDGKGLKVEIKCQNCTVDFK